MAHNPGGDWHPGWGVDLIISGQMVAKATESTTDETPKWWWFSKGTGTPAISGKSRER